jgi:hypothetical protein
MSERGTTLIELAIRRGEPLRGEPATSEDRESELLDLERAREEPRWLHRKGAKPSKRPPAPPRGRGLARVPLRKFLLRLPATCWLGVSSRPAGGEARGAASTSWGAIRPLATGCRGSLP